MLVAVTLRFMVGARRPFEYDQRMKPMSDRYMSSYGFPSIETYMSVIIYGQIALRLKFLLIRLNS